MNKSIQTELEAAAFRQLISHLQQHTEAQNIDLMILADFCRNCLAKWLVASMPVLISRPRVSRSCGPR